MSDSSSSHYNGFDRLILQFDQALRTIVPGSSTQHRVSPADAVDGSNLSDEERRQAASLMRISVSFRCEDSLSVTQPAAARSDSTARHLTKRIMAGILYRAGLFAPHPSHRDGSVKRATSDWDRSGATR